MTNYATGHDAEKRAAKYLETQGYKVLDINWRTKYCEVDIVAQKKKKIYFTEVKYRRSSAYGSGLEYITPQKLKQMKFAAEMWVSKYEWEGDYQLAVLEVSGTAQVVTSFLTDL